MAETQPKRLREESHEPNSIPELNDSNPKRQKPYNNILSLLDEEPEPSLEPSQDLSDLFTTLQKELSSDFNSQPSTAEEEAGPPFQHHQATAESDVLNEDLKSVMRHLLEATDDELGIPNREGEEDKIDDVISEDRFPFAFNDNGLWEIEDEAANYYTVLQSELFM
ncbi:hypothetical protein ACJIZ3_020174 [Penstemon smallii]|uniref:Uncharacterized protein n=1 Tax=Penstemon smallii TaxID=265156 RepID=A0ABD3SI64_9LAMI